MYRLVPVLACLALLPSCADEPDEITRKIAAICESDPADVHFEQEVPGTVGPLWRFKAAEDMPRN